MDLRVGRVHDLVYEDQRAALFFQDLLQGIGCGNEVATGLLQDLEDLRDLGQFDGLAAKGVDDLIALDADLVLDIDPEFVAQDGGRSGKSNSGVSARGIHNGVARVQDTAFLSVPDHGEGNTILDALVRVGEFQFYGDPAVELLLNFVVGELQQRGVSDKFFYGFMDCRHDRSLSFLYIW